MKKYLITILAVLGSSFAAIATSSAQSANFSYNDGAGSPNSGSYLPGSSFTFAISLAFTPGGSVNNLAGVSYWFQQNNASPFYFSIAMRDATGSPFNDFLNPLGTENLAPTNPTDLGGLVPYYPGGEGAGTYFIANITLSIDPSAAPGVYTIQNVISGGQTSVISDDAGNTFDLPASAYTITVLPNAVPEGGATVVLLGTAVTALGALRRKLSA